MSATRTVGCLFLEFLLVTGVTGAERANRPQQFSRLRQAAVDAADRKAATRAYIELFQDISSKEFDSLKSDPDTGIALYARWQSSLSKEPESAAASHPERFAGFLEGRTGLKCPANWVNYLYWSGDVQQAFAPAATHLYQPLGLIELNESAGHVPIVHVTAEKFERILLGKDEFDVPAGTRVHNRRLECDSGSFPLRESFLREVGRQRQNEMAPTTYDQLRAFVRRDSAFVVLSNFGAEATSPLFCLDANSGELIWQGEVWTGTDRPPPRIGGWGREPVALSANDTIVAVFGIRTHFVEAFEIATGKAAFRFHPALWDTNER